MVIIKLANFDECPYCKGTGMKNRSEKCPKCGGSGTYNNELEDFYCSICHANLSKKEPHAPRCPKDPHNFPSIEK